MILRYAGSFNEIGEVIKNCSEPFTKSKINQIFNLYQLNSVCFLVVGDVSICRVSDNLLSMNFMAPAVLGLAQMRIANEPYYMRCGRLKTSNL
jgi:hypothetical protein